MRFRESRYWLYVTSSSGRLRCKFTRREVLLLSGTRPQSQPSSAPCDSELLDKIDRPPLLPVRGQAWDLVLGPRSQEGEFFLFFYCLFGSRGALAQFELEGGDLHGIQADGGVVGQGCARVHQSQGHGLEQLHVQVPEQSRYAQLQRGRERKENRFTDGEKVGSSEHS